MQSALVAMRVVTTLPTGTLRGVSVLVSTLRGLDTLRIRTPRTVVNNGHTFANNHTLGPLNVALTMTDNPSLPYGVYSVVYMRPACPFAVP
ncbi:MAG: hypothetical protein WBD51_21685, partial [Burkholderiaceae bacterium]